MPAPLFDRHRFKDTRLRAARGAGTSFAYLAGRIYEIIKKVKRMPGIFAPVDRLNGHANATGAHLPEGSRSESIIAVGQR